MEKAFDSIGKHRKRRKITPKSFLMTLTSGTMFDQLISLKMYKLGIKKQHLHDNQMQFIINWVIFAGKFNESAVSDKQARLKMKISIKTNPVCSAKSVV